MRHDFLEVLFQVFSCLLFVDEGNHKVLAINFAQYVLVILPKVNNLIAFLVHKVKLLLRGNFESFPNLKYLNKILITWSCSDSCE